MGFFGDIFGRDSAAGRAEDNYEKRRQAAEWNADAKQYISDGQRIYEEAYTDLLVVSDNVKCKIQQFVDYKKRVLDDMNKTLKSFNQSALNVSISTVELGSLEKCAIVQHEEIWAIDRIIDTWVVPSVSDFFVDATEDYYQAKSNKSRAKSFKEQMKTKREQFRNAKYALKEVPNFIDEEKRQIEQLLEKFKKVAQGISSSDQKRADALCEIARLIAESLSVQFLDNNCAISQQYREINRRIIDTNSSASSLAGFIE